MLACTAAIPGLAQSVSDFKLQPRETATPRPQGPVDGDAPVVRPIVRMVEEGLSSPDHPIHFRIAGDAGVLPAHMREIVIDRAMAVPQRPIDIDDLKIIVLMVYWSAGIEPDALVLDELCDDNRSRVAH